MIRKRPAPLKKNSSRKPAARRKPRGLGRGFTLIEVLVVIAIVSTIAAIVFLILNPVEYLKRARDAQRLRDYTFIKQAINYYLYAASVEGATPDLDGPSYADSCAGEASSRLFVSVPQGAESNPEPPPSGWTYNRVPAASLYSVNGSGWLPVDFSSLGGTVPSLTKLPVDPVNTFASGYYYTYTCGSFELNMRFESEKYRTLAQSDGGDDDLVYEVGSAYTAAPYQTKYHPASATASGTLVLYPNATGFYSSWAGNFEDVNEVKGSANDTDRIYTSTASNAHAFELDDPAANSAEISAVRLITRANKVGLNAFQISPRLRSGIANYDSAPISLTTTYTSYTTSFAVSPFTGDPWTWQEITSLQAGVILTTAGPSGTAQVSQIYLEVDYE